MRTTVDIKGLPELEAKLKKLNVSLTGVLRTAVRSACEPIKAAAVRNIHSISGELAKSVTIEVEGEEAATASAKGWAYRRGGTGMSFSAGSIERLAGPQVKVAALVGPKEWYGRLVEYGHQIVPPGKRARKMSDEEKATHGRVGPHPFMRPAFDQTKEMAKNIIRAHLRDAVTRGIR